EPFCLDNLGASIDIPIRINQTDPIRIELLRYDFDTNENETLVITAKEAGRLVKRAKNASPKSERRENQALDLRYTLKRTGIYRLQKVIDKTNLEVQRQASDALVVGCPTAQIRDSRLH